MIKISRVRIILLIIYTLFISLSVWGFFIEPNQLVIKREILSVPNWHKEHENLKFALIADIHAGAPFIRLDKLRKIVDLTNKEKPDVIFLLGDYVIKDVIGGEFIKPSIIAKELNKLKARYAIIAILGNHDWWYDGVRVRNALEPINIPVLENSAVKINCLGKSFWVAGLDDLSMRFPDVKMSLKKINDNNPVIMLSHSPDMFPFVPSRVSLTISGHTHGGQVNFPFFGRPIVPSFYGQRYAYGHIKENNRNLFVTSGIGTSRIPVRFGVTPEIVILTLKPEH